MSVSLPASPTRRSPGRMWGLLVALPSQAG